MADGRWNLAELVSGESDMAAQISAAKRTASNMRHYRKKLDNSTTKETFARALSDKERLAEQISRIDGYASLSHAADTQSDRFTTMVMQTSRLHAELANQTLFFDVWWKKAAAETACRLMKEAGALAGYLKHKRLLAKHALSEPEERLVNMLDSTGAGALVRIYDKITGAFEYSVKVGKDEKKMTREQVGNLVRSRSARTRKAAYVSLLSKFAGQRGLLGEIYQNLVNGWADEAKMRGYKAPADVRHLANNVDAATVDALLGSCVKNRKIFWGFFKAKASALKSGRLRRYDLLAPLSGAEKKFPYHDAVRLVLDSFERFSPEMARMAKRLFDEDHVDYSVRRGKRDGAFCSTISPNVTPYVLVNYTGRLRDVFTLAHELGHAVHSQAASGQSILVQEAPLPLAETASTFAEMLLYDSMDVVGPDLADKLDDLYATILRQSFFTRFEIDAHSKVSHGGTIDDLDDIYLANLSEQFGDSVDVSSDFASEWTCIPHFYHAPFYCYAYSFGNLLALSLFQQYKREGKGFADTYMGILSAGGSEKPEKLLKRHGFDMRSERFWQGGFEYVNSTRQRLENSIPQ